MELGYTINAVDAWTVVEFRRTSLMDPQELEVMSTNLKALVAEQDKRHLIVDFEKVEYLSSQALGMIIALKKEIDALKGKLILCAINDKLKQLLSIVRLDRVLTIKPSQREAIKVSPK